MTTEQKEMIEYTIEDIVVYLMEYEKLSMEEAMDLFYSSKTCEKLEDTKNGLYLEDSSYVHCLYNQEREGKFDFS